MNEEEQKHARERSLRRLIALNKRRAKPIPKTIAEVSASHTISDMSVVYGVHRNTVKKWLDSMGLEPLRR